jgi:hypothetical protein
MPPKPVKNASKVNKPICVASKIVWIFRIELLDGMSILIVSAQKIS